MDDPMSQALQELRLTSYEQLFRENAIETREDLCNLSIEDVKEIGVTKIGDRNRLLSWIESQRSLPFVDVIVNNVSTTSSSTASCSITSNSSLTTTAIQSSWPKPNVQSILDDIDGISYENIFQEAVFYIKENELFCYVPKRSACHEGSLSSLFHYLYIDSDIVKSCMTTLLDRELFRLANLARDNGLPVTVINNNGSREHLIGNIRVNEESVITIAMRLHEMIIHRYSYLNATEAPPSDEDTQTLSVFRKASLSLAVQVAFISQVTQQSEDEVIDAFMEEKIDSAEDSSITSTSPDNISNSLLSSNTSVVPLPPSPGDEEALNTLKQTKKMNMARIVGTFVGAVGVEVGRGVASMLFAN